MRDTIDQEIRQLEKLLTFVNPVSERNLYNSLLGELNNLNELKSKKRKADSKLSGIPGEAINGGFCLASTLLLLGFESKRTFSFKNTLSRIPKPKL